MNEKEKHQQRRADFFARLEGLSTGERTALKRSLGQPLSNADAAAWAAFFKAMPGCRQWEEETYFLVACAYSAFGKTTGPEKSFVGCLRDIGDESDGIKNRLFALLDTPKDNSGFFAIKLSRLLRMIRQKGKRPDFEQLLSDLLDWGNEHKNVRLRWAREYLGATNNDKEESINVN